jgi:tripartite-type tricarboxylate transporter receptor subunit TctC
LSKAANSEPFKTALANLGQEPAYMDQPEFAAFWEADTKRIEAAIRSIGKVDS